MTTPVTQSSTGTAEVNTEQKKSKKGQVVSVSPATKKVVDEIANAHGVTGKLVVDAAVATLRADMDDVFAPATLFKHYAPGS